MTIAPTKRIVEILREESAAYDSLARHGHQVRNSYHNIRESREFAEALAEAARIVEGADNGDG
jgi:hypothetical protein